MQVQGGSDGAALAEARRLAARVSGEDVADVRLVRTMSTTWLAMSEQVVVKVHVPGASREDLARRLALAAAPGLEVCVVQPILSEPVRLDPVQVGADDAADGPGVWGTVWPRVEVLHPDSEDAPWAEAGALLARLHRLALPGPVGSLPEHGAVARLRVALARLDGVLAAFDAGPGRRVMLPSSLVGAVGVVRAAAAGLPPACWQPSGGPGVSMTLVHGDWHLGQLGRPAGTGPGGWRLIDVDDLGVGDPVWDLGRPAAFRAAGLMADDAWVPFLDGYRQAEGPAVPPPPSDPWPALDAVAQACVVLAAAAAVRRGIERYRIERGGAEGDVPVSPGSQEPYLDDLDVRLVEVCSRLPGTAR